MRVALRGDDPGLADAVGDAGGEVVDDGSRADLALAVGDRAVVEALRAEADRPVLPVDADVGRYGVSAERAVGAVDALLAGRWRTTAHPVASVTVAGERVTPAAFDAMLVTTEAARISEYGVRFEEARIAEFRADGVVVATPLGSGGYAGAAGGPLVAPDAGVSVIPVSPFATRRECWVAGGDVTLTVERDEGDVSLVVDGRVVRSVVPGDDVTVSPERRVSLVRAADI